MFSLFPWDLRELRGSDTSTSLVVVSVVVVVRPTSPIAWQVTFQKDF